MRHTSLLVDYIYLVLSSFTARPVLVGSRLIALKALDVNTLLNVHAVDELMQLTITDAEIVTNSHWYEGLA